MLTVLNFIPDPRAVRPHLPLQIKIMPQLKLTYFDFHGGRGEPARLAMHIGGIAFEDHRFSFPEFAEVRKATPFGQVPTLHVDGTVVTQSDAITRYV